MGKLTSEKAKKISKTDLAWAAGFIDGEGCISGIRTGDHQGDIYSISLIVGNTESYPIKKLHGMFGGGYREIENRQIKHNRVYEWRITGKRVLEVLKVIEPYLCCKLAQAELAIIYLESGWRGRRGGFSNTIKERKKWQKNIDSALVYGLKIAKTRSWPKNAYFRSQQSIVDYIFENENFLSLIERGKYATN